MHRVADSQLSRRRREAGWRERASWTGCEELGWRVPTRLNTTLAGNLTDGG